MMPAKQSGEQEVHAALDKAIGNICDTLVPMFDEGSLRRPRTEDDEREGEKDRSLASALATARTALHAAAARLQKMSAACLLLFSQMLTRVHMDVLMFVCD